MTDHLSHPVFLLLCFNFTKREWVSETLGTTQSTLIKAELQAYIHCFYLQLCWVALGIPCAFQAYNKPCFSQRSLIVVTWGTSCIRTHKNCMDQLSHNISSSQESIHQSSLQVVSAQRSIPRHFYSVALLSLAWDWHTWFSLLRDFFTTNSTALVFIGLVRFSVSSWLSLSKLYISRNLAISSRVFHLLVYDCSCKCAC